MEDPDQVLRDFLRDIMEDPHDKTDLMEVMDDLLPHHSDRPFTRKQHIVNLTHKVENIRGTKTTITIDLVNKHHHFWFSKGEVTTATTDGMSSQITTTFESADAKHLLSPSIMRHSLIREILLCLNLTSLDELAELEIQISLCILNAVSAANDEGCSAIDVVFVLEVATVDIYEKKEKACATCVAAPTPRSSIEEALPLMLLGLLLILLFIQVGSM